MKQFTFELLPTPPLGLRPDARAVRRERYLVESLNVRGTEYGLEDYIPVTEPVTGQSIQFPFPQIIRLSSTTYLMLANGVLHEYNDATNPWSDIGPLARYQYDDPSSVATPTAPTDQYDVVDLGDAFYLFSPERTIFKPSMETFAGMPQKIFEQNDVTINSGCFHKGRVVFGGFDNSNFWNDLWQGVFAEWQASFNDLRLETSFNDIGANWVFWSSIGGGDFPLWLFYPDLYCSSAMAPTAARLLELLKRNELGFMQMPFPGTVLSVKALGDNVIVYGDQGIGALTFTRAIQEMPPTYGFRLLSRVGVVARDAVGGNDGVHIFIDKTGDLWQLSTDLNLAKLGYREYLYDLLGGDITVNYNEQQQEFHVSGDFTAGVYGFLLRPQGLFQNFQRVCSGSRYLEGGMVGWSSDDTDPAGLEARIVTSPFDMSTTELKTITEIGADVRSTNDVYVAIDYKYSRNDAWSRGPWHLLNKERNARVQVAGLEFRVALKCAAYAGFELDHLQVHWQRDDKRVTRGPNVDPSVAGAGE